MEPEHEDDADKPVLDPAEYLFQQTKFHDCHLTVGDPATDEVERIAVVTSHLAAHSTVFRDMLVDSALADPSGKNTHITDIRPEIFKLMLKHVYGGCKSELLTMSKETALELALCAEKYNIQPLARRASKRLIPASVEEVFLPLLLVANVPTPVLVSPVTKIIQEETDKVIKNEEFLKLDENSIEYIIKQEKLAVTELELWHSLVKWMENRAQQCSLTHRQIMEKFLVHLRLATLTADEISKRVVPTKILTYDEVVELLTAVANKQSLTSPGLCHIGKKRECSKDIYTKVKIGTRSFSPHHTIIEIPKYKTSSNFMIKIRERDVELQSFKCKAVTDSEKVGSDIYNLSCTIAVYENIGGLCTFLHSLKVASSVFCHNKISLPLKLTNGQPLILKNNTAYTISVSFSIPHPAFILKYRSSDTTNDKNHILEFFTLKYNNFFHVHKITYRV